MASKAFAIFSVCFGFLLSGCNKTEDTQAPSIQWINLETDSTYFAGDTIHCAILASDEKNIDNIRVSLENQSGLNLYSFGRQTLETTNLSIPLSIPIPYGLPSGKYTLIGAASDGTNETKIVASISIQYKESPLQMDGLFILSPANNESDLFYLDNNAFVFLGHLPVDAGFLKIQPSLHQLYVAGTNQASLYCIHANGAVKWTQTFSEFQPDSRLVDVACDSSSVYTATRSGIIYGFSSNGIQTLQIQVETGFYPVKLFVQNGIVLVQLMSDTQPGLLVAYHALTGLKLYQTAFTEVINSFERLDNERVIIGSCSVIGGPGQINVLQLNSNFYSIQDFPLSLMPQKIVSMKDGSNFLVGTNQGINRFTYSPNGFVPLWGEGSVDDFSYQPSTNLLYASKDSILFIYNTFNTQTSLISGLKPSSKLVVME
jgi:hypothetical protein